MKLILVVLLLVSASLHAQTASQAQFRQELEIVGDFALRLCASPELRNSAVSGATSAEAKAAVTGLLKKLSEINLDVKAELRSTSTSGLLPGQFIDAFRSSLDCRQKMVETLTPLILRPISGQQSQNQPIQSIPAPGPNRPPVAVIRRDDRAPAMIYPVTVNVSGYPIETYNALQTSVVKMPEVLSFNRSSKWSPHGTKRSDEAAVYYFDSMANSAASDLVRALSAATGIRFGLILGNPDDASEGGLFSPGAIHVHLHRRP